ncbi:extracellular catalytic domain type 1 short-chain-length polyhydroxyalkanoate depolymerase [Polymorphospora rubra]|uniref:extracellular catalytic domain type 1 short-chain-length polyhydroxyalkanoate depolymerase n=1 Tax=Polymorphospora rubra TaxID=338584 RepID=UPI0033C85928
MRRIARLIAYVLVLTAGAAGCGGPGDPTTAPTGAAAPATTATATRPGTPTTTPPPSPPSPAPGDHTLHLPWEGQTRDTLLHAPPGYRPGSATPLVVVLHGRPSNAAAVRETSRLDATADRHGFLVAYPNAPQRAWNGIGCCTDADDVGFLRHLVGELVSTWGVDPTRVYATGFSAGANMAWKLAVEGSDVFAAVAPVSGGFTGGRAYDDKGYKPPRPVPVVTFVGTSDRSHASMIDGIGRWHDNLGCEPGRPTFVDAGRTVERTTARCADGSEIVHYVLTGMGHAWPGSPAYPPAAIDANEVIWDFFDRHRR